MSKVGDALKKGKCPRCGKKIKVEESFFGGKSAYCDSCNKAWAE